jgi:hypothetical protein
MITQIFENSQKLVFGRTLVAHIGMKGWVGRVGPVPGLLSDLRVLHITASIFGLPCCGTICAKQRFLQKYNSIF